MATLFDELTIGKLTLPNRIVFSPMTRSRADDAGVQPIYSADYYSQRASAGLLISEATNISPMAKGYVRTPGIYSGEQIAAWRHVTNAVHAAGGRFFMQIFHTGRIALPDFLPAGVNQPVAPSAVKADGENYTDDGLKPFVEPRALTIEEVHETISLFATAAGNAIEAGFDGVELHGANGYLVHQFLGTNTNLRSDHYGGSDENRARFLLEIVDAISDTIGLRKLGVKLSPAITFNDIVDQNAKEFYPYVINNLNERNLAYLHISCEENSANEVNWHHLFRPVYHGVYFANRGFTKTTGEQLLKSGLADAIVYGKLFLANPDLPRRFEIGAELNDWDGSTFYTPGKKGYTDYPALNAALKK